MKRIVLLAITVFLGLTILASPMAYAGQSVDKINAHYLGVVHPTVDGRDVFNMRAVALASDGDSSVFMVLQDDIMKWKGYFKLLGMKEDLSITGSLMYMAGVFDGEWTPVGTPNAMVYYEGHLYIGTDNGVLIRANAEPGSKCFLEPMEMVLFKDTSITALNVSGDYLYVALYNKKEDATSMMVLSKTDFTKKYLSAEFAVKGATYMHITWVEPINKENPFEVAVTGFYKMWPGYLYPFVAVVDLKQLEQKWSYQLPEPEKYEENLFGPSLTLDTESNLLYIVYGTKTSINSYLYGIGKDSGTPLIKEALEIEGNDLIVSYIEYKPYGSLYIGGASLKSGDWNLMVGRLYDNGFGDTAWMIAGEFPEEIPTQSQFSFTDYAWSSVTTFSYSGKFTGKYSSAMVVLMSPALQDDDVFKWIKKDGSMEPVVYTAHITAYEAKEPIKTYVALKEAPLKPIKPTKVIVEYDYTFMYKAVSDKEPVPLAYSNGKTIAVPIKLIPK